jgi:hypothetical protein
MESMMAQVVKLVAALAILGAAHMPQDPPADVRLAIPDAVNATPSIAAEASTVVVAWGATSKDNRTDVFVAVSSDGGITFGVPVRVNADDGEAKLTGEAPPRIVIGRALSSGRELTVLWTARDGARTSIKLARSTDGGRTFAAAVPLVTGAAGARGWPALAVGKDGKAHAVWLDHRGMAPAPGATPHAHAQEAPNDTSVAAQKSGLYYASLGSKASAAVAGHEIAKGVCYCCKTALAIHRGRLYAAWRHVYPGNLRDIAFATSTNAGLSFSAPVRVSRDGWEIEGCPDDGPAIAVGNDNVVRMVWPTVIPGSAPQGAIFYASSADGRRFTARVRVPTLGSLKPSHPVLTLDSRGRIVVAWDELVNGRRVVAARLGTTAAGGAVTFGPHEVLNASGHGVYPAVAASGGATVVAWTSGGSDSVINVRRITLRP